MKTYNEIKLTYINPNQIFVFGSNTQGRHGKGAALWARMNAGAIYGQAMGLQGKSYAIITKDLQKTIHPSISIEQIKSQIRVLYSFAKENSKKEFIVAYSTGGTYLNGYTPRQMARMFAECGNIPENMVFEENFAKLIEMYKSDI